MDELDVAWMVTDDGGARYTLEGGTWLLLSYVAILDTFGSAHVGRSGAPPAGKRNAGPRKPVTESCT